MKTRACFAFLSIALLLPLAESKAQVTPVESRNTKKQLEREVFVRWNRRDFDPRWYFILFHNSYRRGEDRRNMLQLAPTLAFIKVNEAKAEEQKDDVDIVYEQEMFKMADRSLNKSYYLLYEKKIKTLNTEIDLANAEAIDTGVAVEHILALMQEKERINADIDIAKDSYMDDALKTKVFRVCLEDLSKLRGYYRRLISIYKTSNKHIKY
ncbi:hypothetical protein [Rufibacter sp. XAAS-G3-1]|uniref:hypothetical protein n=1 Tax=Rufibacter sp. XAAS-G3-1 TaxID=2729134 RepID=UPI0015E643E8|nr:hypothetical protein [Rufibacter sp. XAAS-G3-1]